MNLRPLQSDETTRQSRVQHSLHYNHQFKQQCPRHSWTHVPGLRLRAEQLRTDGSLCLYRLIPFLYSVRVSLSTKSPASLCRSLQASLCLCGIRCPTSKTKPLGKPELSGTSPCCFTHRHTHSHPHTYLCSFTLSLKFFTCPSCHFFLSSQFQWFLFIYQWLLFWSFMLIFRFLFDLFQYEGSFTTSYSS